MQYTKENSNEIIQLLIILATAPSGPVKVAVVMSWRIIL